MKERAPIELLRDLDADALRAIILGSYNDMKQRQWLATGGYMALPPESRAAPYAAALGVSRQFIIDAIKKQHELHVVREEGRARGEAFKAAENQPWRLAGCNCPRCYTAMGSVCPSCGAVLV